MASYNAILLAVENTVLEAKTSMLNDIQKFILEKVDEDSSEAIRELFDEFRTTFNKEVAESKKTTKKLGKERGAKKEKKAKTDRKPSAYNIFVGDKIKAIRAANPGMVAKDAMRQAMEAWKEHKNK